MEVYRAELQFASELSKRKATRYVVLHHAAWSTCTVEDIHRTHLNNGWAGIGYHYFVRKDGSIWRGRPENTVGAHAIGVNTESIGICAEGDYTRENMPEAQCNAIIDLCRDILKRYPQVLLVKHCEVSATDCPGSKYPFNTIVNATYAEEVEDMTEQEVRNIVAEALAKAFPTYEKIEDVPAWGLDSVQWAIDKGILQGDGKGLDLSACELSSIVFLHRLNS